MVIYGALYPHPIRMPATFIGCLLHQSQCNHILIGVSASNTTSCLPPSYFYKCLFSCLKVGFQLFAQIWKCKTSLLFRPSYLLHFFIGWASGGTVPFSILVNPLCYSKPSSFYLDYIVLTKKLSVSTRFVIVKCHSHFVSVWYKFSSFFDWSYLIHSWVRTAISPVIVCALTVKRFFFWTIFSHDGRMRQKQVFWLMRTLIFVQLTTPMVLGQTTHSIPRLTFFGPLRNRSITIYDWDWTM